MRDFQDRWLSATSQVATSVHSTLPTYDLDGYTAQIYRALAIAIGTALGVRSCLVSVRDPESSHNHVSMAMVRGANLLPNGNPTCASLIQIFDGPLQIGQSGPLQIEIAEHIDGPHKNMHSVAAWSGDPVTIVRGHTDRKIRLLDRKWRNVDEWADKVAFFVNWHDNRPLPICTASFATSEMESASRILQDFNGREWSNFYTLCHQRLMELHHAPVQLDGMSKRDLEALECIALYPPEEGAKELGITLKSYRRRRNILAERTGTTPANLPMEAARWMLTT